MKKLSFVIIALLMSCLAIQAQLPVGFDFDDVAYVFDENGLIRSETQDLQQLSQDKIGRTSPRSQDLAWACIVYRIIDMRFKQNYQLYTPLSAEDPMYNSLLKTMLLAVADSMSIYAKSETGDIRPVFDAVKTKRTFADGEEFWSLLDVENAENYSEDEETRLSQRVLKYDSLLNKYTVNPSVFTGYATNQLKYLIMEMVYFDKHYSRLDSRIVAIAPLHADNAGWTKDSTPEEAIWGQILFWVPYEAFRPYMAQQYVTPRGSASKRVTFNDFFSLKLYSSYILGVDNLYGRMIPEICGRIDDLEAKQKAVHKEQQKIETELLNTEQDLWEY